MRGWNFNGFQFSTCSCTGVNGYVILIKENITYIKHTEAVEINQGADSMTLKIGEKIKQLRRTQNVTQEKLADYLNISYQAVSKWENGLHCRDHIFDMQPYS